MATSFPSFDPFDEDIQRMRDNAEQLLYGESGGVGTDDKIRSQFQCGFDRPRVSALVRDAMKNDRWHLGETMVEVGDRLGTDHTAISRALHWGELSQNVEAFLRACPTRPADWERPIDAVFGARHRQGFIEVAEYLATRLPGASWSRSGLLREVHAELLAELLYRHHEWVDARRDADIGFARRIVMSVFEDPTREILPFWYTKTRRIAVSRLVCRLKEDTPFAFRYLCLLQSRWQGIAILAWTATEGMGWVEAYV